MFLFNFITFNFISNKRLFFSFSIYIFLFHILTSEPSEGKKYFSKFQDYFISVIEYHTTLFFSQNIATQKWCEAVSIATKREWKYSYLREGSWNGKENLKEYDGKWNYILTEFLEIK